jgi:hypothetical protein
MTPSALHALHTKPRVVDAETGTAAGGAARGADVRGGDHVERAGGPRPSGSDADGMTVASFVLGLVGLLVGNIFLGPAAVVLALIALARGTRRRGRAVLGLTLGLADLAVLAAFTVLDGTVSWGLTG